MWWDCLDCVGVKVLVEWELLWSQSLWLIISTVMPGNAPKST